MKILNLDSFFYKIRKSIILAESYSEIKNLSSIIKMCRLKPHELLYDPPEYYSIKLFRKWVDEFNNLLIINEKKKVVINYNQLELSSNQFRCSDLYYGIGINKTLKMSKIMYFAYGKSHDDIFIILNLLGVDNYLRCFVYYDGEWNYQSPLLVGFDRLKSISENMDIKYFKTLKNKKNYMIPCDIEREYITYLPYHEDFRKELDLKLNLDFNYLIQGNI